MGFIEELKLVIKDQQYYFVVKCILLLIQTVYFSHTMYKFSQKINNSMNTIIISFQIVLTAELIWDCVLMVLWNEIYPVTDVVESKVFHYFSSYYNCTYITNRVCIILMYRLMWVMKYAELVTSVDMKNTY